MGKLHFAGLLGLASQLSYAYPGNYNASEAVIKTDSTEKKFVFAAIGDSWASGVQYSPQTQYDDNSSGCQRYKWAWSTIIRDRGNEWGPSGVPPPELCFEACSGRQMEHMGEELDKCVDDRPEITFMEVSGNDADFYPMAKNCVFRPWGFGYGKLYEDDDPDKPEGSCRQSIAEVRENIKGIESKYKDTINMWKTHRANLDNGATLFTFGYARFFAMGDECDKWNFQVFIPLADTQRLVKPLREELNELVDLVNAAIRSATESFNDPKIQYIDISPALDGHRFCEPGHDWLSQLNYNENVWLWNQPAKVLIQVKRGDFVLHEWDGRGDKYPGPLDFGDDLKGYDVFNEESFEAHGDETTYTFQNKDQPDQVMLVTFNTKEKDPQIDNGGQIARTLHPTLNGHIAMGDLVVDVLKRTDWPPPNQNLPPLPPENNKALSVIMFMDKDVYKWRFYETNRGERAGCDTDKRVIFEGPPFSGANIEDPPPPQGDYDMVIWDQKCRFHGDGSNRGELICGDEHISCQGPNKDAETHHCLASNPERYIHEHEGAFCEFFVGIAIS